MKTTSILSSILLLATVPAIAGDAKSSFTESLESGSTDGGWSVRSAAYVWGTALDGEMVVRGNTVPVDIGFDDILSEIDFAFTGAVEARKGKWGFMADLFYAKLSADAGNAIAQFSTEIEQFQGHFIASYRWLETPKRVFDTYAGVRVNWIETDVEIDRPILPDISTSGSDTWVDPIIGVRFQQELTEKFYFRALGDVGGFGIESDFTWQAMAGIGYHVNQNSSVLLGYRAIGIDYSNDNDLTYDVTSHGILLGYEMKF